MRDLTLVLPHFCNLGMLAEQQRVWSEYPDDVKRHFHVIVVDDCSPKSCRPGRKSIVIDDLASFRVYRCTRKIRWNWLFARNLGAQQAKTDWILLTDIDHVLPAETARLLMTTKLDPKSAYRLARVDAPHPWPFTIAECPVRENKRFHPNTWLLTKALYDRIGGYDERLSGCYGTDGEFKDRVFANAKAVVALADAEMIRYGREIIPDASTPPEVYTRKNDPENDRELSRRRQLRSDTIGWRPLRVTFPWEEVCHV